jgi:hypothetical protein
MTSPLRAIYRVLARHFEFTEAEQDSIINDDTCLRRGFGGQVKYRLGRDTESRED